MIIGFDGSRSFIKHKTGTENYAFQLLRHLAQIDSNNSYIVYLRPGNIVEEWDDDNGRHSRESENPQEKTKNGSSIKSGMTNNINGDFGWPSNFEFKMLNYPRLWTQFGLAKQTFKDKLDVLFVPSHTLPLIRNPKLKTVMTVHDLGAEYLPGMHQLKQQLYLGLMTKIQLKTATKLIAVSQATKKDLVSKIGINPKQVEVVYEGLNALQKSSKSNSNLSHSEIDKKVSDIDKQYQIIINNKPLYKTRYFLFVGTIQPRKNLERLIKAYAGFLNCHPELASGSRTNGMLKRVQHDKQESIKLVLAGGKGWLADDILALPKKLGIEANVIFTGRVSDNDLTTLYENALAFTFPSLFEGFGLPILEAFEAKIPVITSNNSSLPEVAGDAGLLVDPYKTEEMLNALLKIYNDKSMQSELVKKGTEQLKKFSWEKCARETLAVLENTG